MNKYLAFVSALIASVMLLASCSSSDADTITEQSFPSCFAYACDITNNVDATYTQVGYTLRLNYTKLTADVTINNLRTTDGATYPTILVQNIPWTIDPDGYIKLSGSNLQAKTNSGSPLVFSSFNLRLMERVVNNTYSPGFVIYYTINMQHTVVSSNSQQIIFGKTTSTDENGSSYESDKTIYQFGFNVDTRRLKLSMVNANFMAGMPAMNIDLENIPFRFDGQSARFEVDAITPKIGGTPYESFPITNLSGRFDFGSKFTMSFICDPAKAPGKYSVTADCSFKYTAE